MSAEPRKTREYFPPQPTQPKPVAEKPRFRNKPPEKLKPQNPFHNIGDTLKNVENPRALLGEEKIVWQGKNESGEQQEESISFKEMGITSLERRLLEENAEYLSEIIRLRYDRGLALFSRKIISSEKQETKGSIASLRNNREIAQIETVLTATLQSLSRSITREILKKYNERSLLQKMTDFLEPPLHPSNVEEKLFLALKNYFIESRNILAIQSITPREEVVFLDALGKPQPEICSLKEKSVQKITFANIPSFDLPVPPAYQRYITTITISINFSDPKMPATCTVT